MPNYNISPIDEDKMSDFVPKLTKKDIENMVPDLKDEITEQSEVLTVEWVHAFLEEINKIENFFLTK